MQKKESIVRPTNIRLSKEQPKVIPKKSKVFIDPTIEKGEIIWAKVTYKDGDGRFSKNMVYKRPNDGTQYGDYFQKVFKRRYGVTVDKIIRIDIIKRVGFEHKYRGFSLGVKSDEKRDSKTGKYD